MNPHGPKVCSRHTCAPVTPSLQPSLFKGGSPSPEGTFLHGGALGPHLDIKARQMVPPDELVANHLWEEGQLRPSQGLVLGASPRPHSYLDGGAPLGRGE